MLRAVTNESDELLRPFQEGIVALNAQKNCMFRIECCTFTVVADGRGMYLASLQLYMGGAWTNAGSKTVN